MKLYRIYARQTLPISLQEAWAFLSNPKSLGVITPKPMSFQIRSGAEKSIFAGQIIQYTVKPFPFFKTRWVTEITHVVDETYFVDEQRIGPYVFWHHKHFLRGTNYGVELQDVVDYKLPFGFFGQFLHFMFIKRQLQAIFEYREQELGDLFGRVKGIKSRLEMTSI